ncbi:MAG: GTP cyclohydrolase I FolE [Lewinellaceae bacterium]|nr:GTP cyclohydrolase I FolE [Lewinellaceae bacterium]
MVFSTNHPLNGKASSNGIHQADKNGSLAADDLGEAHIGTSLETPLKPDAFALSDEAKMQNIEGHFRAIMDILGLDLKDDSLQGTPKRVAKMFVKEIFNGLNPANKPRVSLFENKFGYDQMLVEKNIRVQSFCEHHFLPIYGKAHIAYIANGQVIGLSKLNRIVDYYARRPQVQERLTMQIAEELRQVLHTEDVAVYIEAYHMCVQARGVEHQDCTTVTTAYSGAFDREDVRAEFLHAIKG